MLLVSREQWEEVFDRLQWGPDSAGDLWSRMGGGPRKQLDWTEVYRLITAAGWSEKHAQVLWITLNNFAPTKEPDPPAQEPTPSPAEEAPQPTPEPETYLAPAPWERAAAVYSGQVDDIPVVQPAGGKKRGVNIQLPAWLVEIDRRLLIFLGVAVVVGVLGFIFLGGGSGSQDAQNSNPAPNKNTNVLLYQGTMQTYFSWKTKNPALQLCLMTQGCSTPQLNARINKAGLGGQETGIKLYRQIGASYKKAAYKELSNGSVQVTIPVGRGSYCGIMVKDQGAWKMKADQNYNWSNLLLGTAWKPCS